MVCTVVVNGLNYFQVGFPSELPSTTLAVDPASYPVCGVVDVGVSGGLVINVDCSETGLYQYVIVQSIDTSAEKLCIAEVCAFEAGQYAVTFAYYYTQQRIAYLSLIAICMKMEN